MLPASTHGASPHWWYGGKGERFPASTFKVPKEERAWAGGGGGGGGLGGLLRWKQLSAEMRISSDVGNYKLYVSKLVFELLAVAVPVGLGNQRR
jgi:hypothetical protein